MNNFTDWKPAFKALFSIIKINRLIELGMGKGTKLFIDNCDYVKSVELAATQNHKDWYKKCIQEYSQKNWHHELFETKDDYSRELANKINKVYSEKYDLVFIDPGIHCRAKLVNLAFGKIPIIVTHDTNFGYEDYEWGLLESPKDYTKVIYTAGQGTSFWIRDKKLAKKFQKEIDRELSFPYAVKNRLNSWLSFE
jgi:hypothetical protein